MLEIIAAATALLVALKNQKNKSIGFAAAKEPWWYGIKSVQFIYHGEWADPELYYRGRFYNATVAEDYLYDMYKSDEPGVEFEEWMKSNQDLVKEELRYNIEPNPVEDIDRYSRQNYSYWRF